MVKVVGISALIVIVLSAGLSFISFSAYKERVAKTEKTIAVQAHSIEALYEEIGTLRKAPTFLGASKKAPADAFLDKNEADIASYRHKLLMLEDEVAAIRVLLEDEINSRKQNRNTDLLAAQKNNQDETLENQWPPADVDGALGPVDPDREKTDEELRQLDELMISDEPDPEWSGVMVEKLASILDEVSLSVDSDVSVISYDCKSVLCRVETLSRELSHSYDLEQEFLDDLAEDIPQMITTRNQQENGDVISTFYLIRDNNNLKQILPAE